MVKTYWQVGRRIVEEEQQGEKRAEYGKQIITLLAEDLSKSYNRGFTARDLRSYRQFYLSFKDLEIWHSRVPNLSWTHFRTMLRVADDNARYWYMREASKEMWSVRTLDRNIASQYYYRLLQSPKKEDVIEEMHQLTAPLQDPHEFIKSPVVAEFLGLPSNAAFTETELERAIIHHLKDFLLEMGKGFAFVAEQQHIRTEQNDYFIDLVFYNYLLKSFVLIDLKTTRLSYQDVGQMDMYLQMYDELKRTEGDNPTVGIILCSETDGDVARYSTLAKNDKLFAAKYLTYLPTEEQLRKEIEQQKILFEQQNHESD
jgi:predicted nuclease of restriction endonuclease-like (RecB) superfamily